MKKTLIMFVAGLTVLASCKKDEPVTPTANPTPQPSYSSITEYFNSNSVDATTYTINAGAGGTFTTSKGSVVTIPANAFQTYSGATVTGNVTLTMKEVFSNSDIIFSGIFPVSGNTFLNSGGEYYLQASQNGQDLTVTPGVMVNVEIPAQAEDPGMMLFFGGGDEEELDTLGWQPVDTTWTNSGFTFNSADDSYSIDLDSLGWGNIDAFNWNVNYFTCHFQLDGVSGLDNSNTKVYAVFKGENTVWPTGEPMWGGINTGLVTDSHLAAIDMNVLAISVVNGELYYGLLDVIPAANQTYTINMVATTDDDLDAVINGLP